MDVWEHAFLLDYKPSERGQYIQSFFANIDWEVVGQRLEMRAAARTAA
jgi:Fe-Mn family superoxide dismutase